MRWTACTITATLLWAALPLRADESSAGVEFFEQHVRPLLIDRCYACHSAEAADLKGGLRLDTKEGVSRGGVSGKPALVAGDVNGSQLLNAVRRTLPKLKMPPKEPLSAAEVKVLETWVALGAPDPRTAAAGSQTTKPPATQFWTFQPPREPTLPAVKDAAWARTPIDSFILAKLEAAGLRPAPEADRRTLIRRASFDLAGLPPSPEDVDAFVADSSPDAYDRLIERLLASPHYGERWGRHWLDLARYSDTKGYVYRGEERTFVHAANYRDWVVAALNADMPYDRFVLLQLAADGATAADGAKLPQDLAAMGFLTVGRRFLGVVPDIIDDRMDIAMRTTQGLTLGCARCHDHKFDPIPTADYYSLYGVFSGSTEKTVSVDPEPARTDAYAAYEKGYAERAKTLEDTVSAKTAELTARLRVKAGEYLAAVPAAGELPEDLFVMILGPEDLSPAVIRQWQLYLLDRAKSFDPVWQPWTSLSALPAADFAAKAPGVLQALLADTSRPLNPRVAAAFAGVKLTAINDVAAVYGKLLTDVNTRWLAAAGGATNPTTAPTALPSPEDEAIRAVLYAADTPARVPAGSVKDIEWFFDEPTRVQFGTQQAEIDRWIINSPGAPRHAVVLVDRPEQNNPRVFKRGNPATKGEEVSRHFLTAVTGPNPPAFKTGSGRLEMARAIASKDNPLTARVIANRVWAHHFDGGLVSTPSDFGTRSEPPTHPELLDWLAVRFMRDGWSIKSLHRLVMKSATYRQSSAHNAAGDAADPNNRLLWRMNRTRLNFESMRDALLAASGELDLKIGGKSGDVFGTRRTLYASIDRQYLPNVFRTFDFANPDLHIPQRAATSVPQQALFFLNAPFLSARARALAARPEVKDAASDADRVSRLIRAAYQRNATPGEIEAAVRFVRAAEAEAAPAVAPAAPASPWHYGFGSYDSSSDRLATFTPLPHFTGEAYQGGTAWPDAVTGWVQLTPTGGHAGNDPAHAAVRRWVAPRDVAVRVEGEVKHEHMVSDGVTARLVSSRTGSLGQWTVRGSSAAANFARVELKAGDTLDFVVDYNAALNTDMFTWAPVITALEPATGDKAPAAVWNAANDFAGPDGRPQGEPLEPWAALAHALLLANEFVFVD